MKTYILLIMLLCSSYLYSYNDDKTMELHINGGYSIITHEKSIFWDNGYNIGLGISYYLSEDIYFDLNASYTAYYPRPEINQIDREYEYEICPLILSLESQLGEINDLEIYGGIGLAYIYGEYQIDDIQSFTNRTKIILRRRYASNGFGIIPKIKLRSPFGKSIALDISMDYNLIFMESRNNAKLSLDHINLKLSLVYIY